MLRGKVLYWDIWFDKPPLYALLYTLWGASAGLAASSWPAHLFVCLSCFIAWRCLSQRSPGESAGLLAAVLLALHLNFRYSFVHHGSGSGSPYRPAAFRCDLLSDEAACVCFRHVRGSGSALQRESSVHCSRRVYCGHRGSSSWLVLHSRISLPCWVLFMTGSLDELLAASLALGCPATPADTFIERTLSARELVRTSNWLGFHATLRDCGSCCYYGGVFRGVWQRWMCVFVHRRCVPVSRFFPRYYFQLAPRVYHVSARRGSCCFGLNGALLSSASR